MTTVELVSAPVVTASDIRDTWKEPTASPSVKMPNSRPMSPSRVTTNALTAAARASRSSQCWPMST